MAPCFFLFIYKFSFLVICLYVRSLLWASLGQKLWHRTRTYFSLKHFTFFFCALLALFLCVYFPHWISFLSLKMKIFFQILKSRISEGLRGIFFAFRRTKLFSWNLMMEKRKCFKEIDFRFFFFKQNNFFECMINFVKY